MKTIVAAGGTAGHINPALALCQELRSRNPENEILFIGTSDRMESDLVPRAGFNYRGIEASGFSRSMNLEGIKHNIGAVAKYFSASDECRKIIRDFAPDVVVGFGGYVSGPVVRTAQKMGIKTAIHEQNAFPGKANIALAKHADAIMLTVPDAEKHMQCGVKPIVTGLPVRTEILESDKSLAREKLGISAEQKVVLITGGSLGAQAINNVICEILPEYIDNDSLLFVHGYGSVGKEVPGILLEKGIDIAETRNARVSEYIYNMGEYMAAADLMICRAGASTIAEIQVMGKSAMLIPYPYATENHQYYNALALSDRDAGILVEQKDFSADKVREIIDRLLSRPEEIAVMGENAKQYAISDAAKRICDIVISLNK